MIQAGALPGAVRIRRAPPCEPPYDDERPPDWPNMDPWQPPLDFAAVTHPPDRPRLTGRAAGPLLSPPPTAPASPDTRAAVQRFLTVCVEVLNGFRPAHHLRALSDPLAAVEVIEAMAEAARQVRSMSGRVRVRKVRLCEPRSGVVEIAAVVTACTAAPPVRAERTGVPAGNSPMAGDPGRRAARSGRASAPAADRWAGASPTGPGGGSPGRSRALACRLEQRNGRWRCRVAQLL